MTKSVKCYNYLNVLRMLDLYNGDNQVKLKEFLDLLKQNDVEIFQPPYFKSTSGPVRRPEHYIKSNKWFDDYMKKKNTWSVLQGGRLVKPGYKKYEKPVTEEQQSMFIYL